MIQINLIPESKSKIIKSKRQQRLFFSIMFIMIGVIGLIVSLLGYRVYGLQRGEVSKLDDGIAAAQARIDNITDLDRMVTVVNNNNGVGVLLDNRLDLQRIQQFLGEVQPSNVIVDRVTLSYGSQPSGLNAFNDVVFRDGSEAYALDFSITGTTNTQKSLNAMVDTLKFAEYTYIDQNGNRSEPALAFTTVVNDTWSLTSDSQDPNSNITFQISAKMDVNLYDPSLTGVSIRVPDIISSPSAVESPCTFRSSCNPE